MSTTSYRCPNCGAHIEYNISKQQFDCAYCSSVFSEEQMQEFTNKKQEQMKMEAKRDFEKEKKQTTQFQEQAITYVCKQCGAEIVSEKNTISTFCLYCHSPNIMQSRMVEEYTPDKVLPFQFDDKQARAKFLEWTNKVAFLPADFTSEQHLSKISGLYAPYWLYDVDSNFEMKGKAIKSKTWIVGNYRHTQIDTYEVKRVGTIKYVKVPVDASQALDNKQMEMLEPYDYSQLKDFDMSYLSGHYAEKYDDSKEALYPALEYDLKQSSESELTKMLSGYSKQEFEKRNIDIKQAEVNYTFMPIWFLNYKYNGKDYAFTMNGQSGKVVGDLPLDKTKQRQFFLKWFLIAFAIILVGTIIRAVTI